MGWKGQQAISFAFDCDCYYFFYYEYTVQFFETAIGNNFCDSGIYIGVFLTFYWFKLNFDQGGFASFVLLCGITVNASIYILNEYNSVRKRFPRLSPLRAYVKAWNTKVIPIFLTVTSTILGFVPFMVGMEKEGFWFPLAAGTIGGLIMSVIGVFIFLPVFTLKKKCLVKPKAML